MLATTGPGLVSRTLAEYPAAGEQVKVLFPEDIFDRNSWHCFGAYGVISKSAHGVCVSAWCVACCIGIGRRDDEKH